MPPLQQFQRTRYFSGRMLSAEDLQREQDYHRDKGRLHNRLLHGWGVVDGLQVSVDRGSIVLSPGVALDCAGHELVLPDPVRLPLPRRAGRYVLTLRYTETAVDPSPDPDGGMPPGAIREEVAVELCDRHPAPRHPRPGPPGCGEAHALGLATVTRRGARWAVTPLKVRLRG
ncbi:MAG: hypothetical protein AB7O28_17670 [Vicinamibacterales bacterium]